MIEIVATADLWRGERVATEALRIILTEEQK
jgi:hypothetical protein